MMIRFGFSSVRENEEAEEMQVATLLRKHAWVSRQMLVYNPSPGAAEMGASLELTYLPVRPIDDFLFDERGCLKKLRCKATEGDT